MASSYRTIAGFLCLGGALVAVGFVIGSYCADGCGFTDGIWETLPADLDRATDQLREFVGDARVSNVEGSSVPGCEETNSCFSPYTVFVRVGGTVTWTNMDVAAHTVTSGVLANGGPDGIFDSGLFVPGAEFSYVFEEAGEYPYFCLVHPWMVGLVVVG